MKKLTFEEVKKYIENHGYTLLSTEYKNNKTKINIKCPKGHIFDMKFNSFKSGVRCPVCCGNQKLSYEYVKKYIENYEYKLLSKSYKNNRTKLEVMCPEGHIFSVRFNNFKNGSRCPICYGHVKYSYDEVKNVFEYEGYKLLSNEYINKDSKLEVMCPEGHIYFTSLNVFKRGFRCPHCSGKAKHNLDFIRYFLNKNGYELLSTEYINAHTPIYMKCPEGHIFKMRFGDFKNNNRRCPICSSSNGELEVSYILDNLGIKYIREYIFKDCKFKSYLPFDFYLPEYNILIEYDGIQHYEVIDYFGGFDGFVDTKIRDTVKNIYCDKNNIKLIRIPYFEFDNIKNIIDAKINKMHKVS